MVDLGDRRKCTTCGAVCALVADSTVNGWRCPICIMEDREKLRQRVHDLETKLGGPETPLLCLLDKRLTQDLKQVPTKVIYLKEWKTCLSWCIDMLDHYDKYLAEKDGYEKVYTDVHVKMKDRVRSAIDMITKGIEWSQDEQNQNEHKS